MTATWSDDGIELLVKMFAGLESIPHYGLDMDMGYTDADFSWPDYLGDWVTRSGNVVTVSRTPLCATSGVITDVIGRMGDTYGGFNPYESLMYKTGINNAIVSGETANPKMIIEFTR